MQTIQELATDLGCTPQALYKAKKRAESATGQTIQGIESDSDKRKILYSEEQLEVIKRFSNVSETKAELPKIEVIEGNHCQGSELAAIPQNYSLEQFRSSSTRLELSLDSSEYLASLNNALDTIEGYMAVAEQKQAQELQKIQGANRVAKKRLKQFQDRATEHKLKTEIQAQLQNSAIADFQDIADQVSDLGLGK